MQEYCRQDVNLTVDLFKHLDSAGWSDESIELEHQAAELCRRIGDAGWTFDMEKATALMATWHTSAARSMSSCKTCLSPGKSVRHLYPSAIIRPEVT